MQGGRFYKHGVKFMITQRQAAGGIKQSTNIHSLMNMVKKQSEMVEKIHNVNDVKQKSFDDGYGGKSIRQQ